MINEELQRVIAAYANIATVFQGLLQATMKANVTVRSDHDELGISLEVVWKPVDSPDMVYLWKQTMPHRHYALFIEGNAHEERRYIKHLYSKFMGELAAMLLAEPTRK